MKLTAEQIAARRRFGEDEQIKELIIEPLQKQLEYFKDVRNADDQDEKKRLAMRDAHAEVTNILENILKEMV